MVYFLNIHNIGEEQQISVHVCDPFYY